MEHASVLLVEDNPASQEAVRDVLENSGHQLLKPVDTREKALEALDLIKDGALDCEVVILDGNLSRRSTNGEDARVIADRIRELKLPLKIIGFSIIDMSSYGIEVDADPTKDGYEQIPNIIDNFPELNAI